VRTKLRELDLKGYRYFVEVVIGCRRNQGMHIKSKCLWDNELDVYASSTYLTDSIFCVTSAYGVYKY